MAAVSNKFTAQQLIDLRERTEVRIMLIGKSGHGKSSTGNSLLANKTMFPKSAGTASFTKRYRLGVRTFNGKELMIYDTPGLFDTQDEHAVIKVEISRAIQLTSPGLHAFLLLFKIGNRFTDEEKKTIEIIREMFGNDADKFCILVLTGEDNLIEDGMTVENYLKEADSGLKQLLEQCQNRYIMINNRSSQQEIDEKLQKLLEMIETMLARNQTRYYTNEEFQKVEQELQEREKQRIEAEIRKKEEEENVLREKIREEFQESVKQLEKEREELLKKFAKDLRLQSRNEAAGQQTTSIVESVCKMIPSVISAVAPMAIQHIAKASNSNSDKKEEKNSLQKNDAQSPPSNQQSTSSNDPVQPVSSEVPITQADRQPVIITGIPTLVGGLLGLKLKN